ncbi:GntR family transcriptional regulator [Cellulomonas sp. C5510]|uniref:GntR family transcriptional regulator n=1 Tax=Cellulomonas sp. C5510 TaxID=2871170 RepID=UPI001C9605A9|nr:GntR family transcriptional regulator [Cellulomonas sp. C5510]QZN85280.1 GntR family transcriptional regulator [Cellulomonas sp. C5510]
MITQGAVQAVHERLTEDLRVGRYAPGSRLPGERELSTRLGVSRTTLRQALAALEEDGALERSAQRGWFVPRQVIGEPPSTLQSFTEMARSRGLRPSSRVLRQEVRPATFEEADRLAVAPASPVLQLDRLRGMDGVPVCYDVVVVPRDRAAALVDADLTDRSLYEELRTRCGIAIHRSAYSVQADAADDRLAALLGTAVGAPVLVGREVAYTADGAPVLVGVNHYRGDAYRFEADLYRPGP